MAVVREICGLVLRVPGEPYSGWLPRGAAPPRGTDTKDVQLDLEIHALDPPDAGFLLVSSSADAGFAGDTWHQTLELALQQAESDFGVQVSEWTLVTQLGASRLTLIRPPVVKRHTSLVRPVGSAPVSVERGLRGLSVP